VVIWSLNYIITIIVGVLKNGAKNIKTCRLCELQKTDYFDSKTDNTIEFILKNGAGNIYVQTYKLYKLPN
jgi:hypothetical protein